MMNYEIDHSDLFETHVFEKCLLRNWTTNHQPLDGRFALLYAG